MSSEVLKAQNAHTQFISRHNVHFTRSLRIDSIRGGSLCLNAYLLPSQAQIPYSCRIGSRDIGENHLIFPHKS